MCVKEYLGFNCGHCAIPMLRACPLTASQTGYPYCTMPAERPIFTNEYCPPCSRVVWNVEVLKVEEVHRQMHVNGECRCNTLFTEAEREGERLRREGPATPTPTGPKLPRRNRPGKKNKNKGKGKWNQSASAREEDMQMVPHASSSSSLVAEPESFAYDNAPVTPLNQMILADQTTPPNQSQEQGNFTSGYTQHGYVAPEGDFIDAFGQPARYNVNSYHPDSDLGYLASGRGFPYDGYVPYESWRGWAPLWGYQGPVGTPHMWFNQAMYAQQIQNMALEVNNQAYADVAAGQGGYQNEWQPEDYEQADPMMDYHMGNASTVTDATIMPERKYPLSEAERNSEFAAQMLKLSNNPANSTGNTMDQTEANTKANTDAEAELKLITDGLKKSQEPSQPMVVSSGGSWPVKTNTEAIAIAKTEAVKDGLSLQEVSQPIVISSGGSRPRKTYAQAIAEAENLVDGLKQNQREQENAETQILLEMLKPKPTEPAAPLVVSSSGTHPVLR